VDSCSSKECVSQSQSVDVSMSALLSSDKTPARARRVAVNHSATDSSTDETVGGPSERHHTVHSSTSERDSQRVTPTAACRDNARRALTSRHDDDDDDDDADWSVRSAVTSCCGCSDRDVFYDAVESCCRPPTVISSRSLSDQHSDHTGHTDHTDCQCVSDASATCTGASGPTGDRVPAAESADHRSESQLLTVSDNRSLSALTISDQPVRVVASQRRTDRLSVCLLVMMSSLLLSLVLTGCALCVVAHILLESSVDWSVVRHMRLVPELCEFYRDWYLPWRSTWLPPSDHAHWSHCLLQAQQQSDVVTALTTSSVSEVSGAGRRVDSSTVD